MTAADTSRLRTDLAKNTVQWISHLTVLALSIWLIVEISIDTLHNDTFYDERSFLKWQLWICVAFMADFFIDMIVAERKWRYLCSHIIFLLVSIPYQYILEKLGWHVPRDIAYLIRYMPLIRGGYAMAYVVSWFTSDRATGLFLSYIITMLSTVYFCSLTFYLFEHHVNPDVGRYTDALWWSAMCVTTEGCDISPVTGVGKALAFLLAGMGIIMLPVFTVYVTNIINKKQQASEQTRLLESYRQLLESKGQHTAAPEASGQTQPSTASREPADNNAGGDVKQ